MLPLVQCHWKGADEPRKQGRRDVVRISAVVLGLYGQMTHLKYSADDLKDQKSSQTGFPAAVDLVATTHQFQSW